MTIEPGILWGMTFGLIGSCTLNLGKSIQKQGIEVKGSKARKGGIWILGSILSFIQPLFQSVGITFLGGDSTVYSAMLGAGIIIVLLYSHFVLKEEIQKIEVAGACLIIAGTLTYGVASISLTGALPSNDVIWTNFTISIIVALSLFATGIIFTLKTKKIWGLIWGAIGGACGGLDNVLKDISGIFFWISFASGIMAFLLTNYGYTRAKAVTVVPAYTVFYILLPMFLNSAIYLNFPNFLQVLGIIISLIGVVLSTAFRKAPDLAEG
ncbi:MAG: hypothetical protein ACTSUE_00060 [Promethearchaeota archaeon]